MDSRPKVDLSLAPHIPQAMNARRMCLHPSCPQLDELPCRTRWCRIWVTTWLLFPLLGRSEFDQKNDCAIAAQEPAPPVEKLPAVCPECVGVSSTKQVMERSWTGDDEKSAFDDLLSARVPSRGALR